MQYSLVMGLNRRRVMQHLHFCLETSHWLRLFDVVDHHHSASDIFPDELLVGLRGLQAKAGQLSGIGLMAGHSVDMYRLDYHRFELLEFVGPHQAGLIEHNNSRLDYSRDYESNSFDQEVFVDFELERLPDGFLDGDFLGLFHEPEELGQGLEAHFGDARDGEDGADVS